MVKQTYAEEKKKHNPSQFLSLESVPSKWRVEAQFDIVGNYDIATKLLRKVIVSLNAIFSQHSVPGIAMVIPDSPREIWKQKYSQPCIEYSLSGKWGTGSTVCCSGLELYDHKFLPGLKNFSKKSIA